MEVVVGVDSHKVTFSAGAIDQLGRVVEAKEFENEKKGHIRFLKSARTKGKVMRIGVECSETYGAALTRFLLAAGENVREVPTRLAHREAGRKKAQGKSDLGDAVAIARVVLREEGLPSSRRPEVAEDLKILSDYRDQLRRARTQLTNRLHRDLVIIRPGYQKVIEDLAGVRVMKKVLKLIDGDDSVRAELMRRRVEQVQKLDGEKLRVSKELRAKVAESGTTLTEITGVSDFIAGRIIGEIGDIRKVKSKAAFGHLSGTAPIPASSGVVVRHRLNQAGNRRINHALWLMSLTRSRIHPGAREYLDRKRAEGKTNKEAFRCLKRHLANVVYRRMVEDLRRLEAAVLTT
jgi:transposase